MSVLVLEKVSKSYGEGATQVSALREVDLTVEAGHLVAIMGPSGSGKSTLLTIAGSLEEPSSGEVLVLGRPLSKMSRAEKAQLRRRTIGFVFQDFNLLPGLTAAENVSLPLELDGIPARRAKEAAAVHTFPISSRAASASGWRSPAPSSGAGSCSSQTSRRVLSTRSTAKRSCGSSARRVVEAWPQSS